MAGPLFSRNSPRARCLTTALTRTVTEMDNVLFTTLTMNPQPLHPRRRVRPHHRIRLSACWSTGIFTLGLVIGISVGDTTLGTTVANLGM